MRRAAYSLGLLLAFATALTSYFTSTFLAGQISERAVGSIYALAAILSLLALSLAPKVVAHFNLKTLVFINSIVSALAALTLAAAPNAAAVVIAFVIFYSSNILLRLLSDFYLEESSDNTSTGSIRGIFLTLINLGWLLSPLVATYLIDTGGYQLLYLVTSFFFLPLGLLIIQHDAPPHIKRENVWLAFRSLLRPLTGRLLNIRRILIVDLWLNTFYALMVVYMPIYLHQHIGLSWANIGIIFTWMLLPFVLVDYPLGWLADKKWGEKEILAAGLVIAGLATIIVSTVNSAEIFTWSLILFLTRVGAASVEIMKETYLFKKIDGADLDILSISRNLIPLSYLVGPVIALVIISLFPLNYLFTLLGISAFFLLPLVWKLADTK